MWKWSELFLLYIEESNENSKSAIQNLFLFRCLEICRRVSPRCSTCAVQCSASRCGWSWITADIRWRHHYANAPGSNIEKLLDMYEVKIWYRLIITGEWRRRVGTPVCLSGKCMSGLRNSEKIRHFQWCSTSGSGSLCCDREVYTIFCWKILYFSIFYYILFSDSKCIWS